MNRTIKISLIVFGIVDSLYLLLPSDTCPLNGCSNLTFWNINIPALLGLIWFSFYPFMKGKMLKIWQIAAILGVAFLSIYAIATSYYCPYCLSAYLAGVLIIFTDKNKLK